MSRVSVSCVCEDANGTDKLLRYVLYKIADFLVILVVGNKLICMHGGNLLDLVSNQLIVVSSCIYFQGCWILFLTS